MYQRLSRSLGIILPFASISRDSFKHLAIDRGPQDTHGVVSPVSCGSVLKFPRKTKPPGLKISMTLPMPRRISRGTSKLTSKNNNLTPVITNGYGDFRYSWFVMYSLTRHQTWPSTSSEVEISEFGPWFPRRPGLESVPRIWREDLWRHQHPVGYCWDTHLLRGGVRHANTSSQSGIASMKKITSWRVRRAWHISNCQISKWPWVILPFLGKTELPQVSSYIIGQWMYQENSVTDWAKLAMSSPESSWTILSGCVWRWSTYGCFQKSVLLDQDKAFRYLLNFSKKLSPHPDDVSRTSVSEDILSLKFRYIYDGFMFSA